MAKDAKDKKVKRPTALKRDLQNERKRKNNSSFKASIRTAVRKFESDIAAGNAEAAKTSLSEVYSMMDKAVGKGIYKKNKASRCKARLTARTSAVAG